VFHLKSRENKSKVLQGVFMKSLIILTLALLSLNVFAGDKKGTQKTLREYANECRTTEVVVDEIVRNSHIKGHIQGLPPEAYDKFKVVFYVKTNRWYVHPYTYTYGQESGYSFSNIDRNGNFWVRTVRRDVPAHKMVAVLVPNSYKIGPQRFFLRPVFGIFGGVLRNQCSHTIIQGNGDFFL
jgi:hypothetical protein